MRRLFNAKLLHVSIAASVLTALLCAPYILYRATPEVPWLAQLAILLVVGIVMWQTVLAWSPEMALRLPKLRARAFAGLIAAAVMLALLQMLLDPWFATYVDDYYPQDAYEMLVTVPWLISFQTLFLVAIPYTFAWRLSRRESVATATVIVFYELVMALQLKALTGLPLGVMVLVGGLRAAVLVYGYRIGGFAATTIVWIILYLRFFIQPGA